MNVYKLGEIYKQNGDSHKVVFLGKRGSVVLEDVRNLYITEIIRGSYFERELVKQENS